MRISDGFFRSQDYFQGGEGLTIDLQERGYKP